MIVRDQAGGKFGEGKSFVYPDLSTIVEQRSVHQGRSKLERQCIVDIVNIRAVKVGKSKHIPAGTWSYFQRKIKQKHRRIIERRNVQRDRVCKKRIAVSIVNNVLKGCAT